MGKGGGGDGGAKAARQAEAARRSRIAGNIGAVKNMFYNPGTEDPTQARLDSFADIESRVRNRFTPDFDQDIGDAQRELKFALSRRNLLGSSGQVDAESRLDDRIAEGQRGISERVASARSGKETYDQNLMNNLLGQAQSDVSRTSLLGGLGASLSANSDRAISQVNQQALGNIFGDVGNLFKEINDQRAVQAGLGNANLLQAQQNTNPSNLFSRNSQAGGNGVTTTF